ncbi:hypothetical protein INT43_007171 [Umbelopsis isabellina]|uniref:Uncharacterized protein n=1 Tax=Mortierella isabellina TaxID=91625 RepID=A0A8H7UKI6_MORIS|nr:hypothetical protein INT43_007171 [Umbelopsis isabellina]
MFLILLRRPKQLHQINSKAFAFAYSFCNNVTMAWNCKCSANNNAANATYLEPVTLAECNGKFVACQAVCPADANRSTCVQACTSKWACGTANSPPSYLQTQSATDQPSYDGPPPAPAPAPSNSTQTNSTAPISTAKASSSQKMDIRHEFVALLPMVLLALFQVQL